MFQEHDRAGAERQDQDEDRDSDDEDLLRRAPDRRGLGGRLGHHCRHRCSFWIRSPGHGGARAACRRSLLSGEIMESRPAAGSGDKRGVSPPDEAPRGACAQA
jgi:hypothetical protein